MLRPDHHPCVCACVRAGLSAIAASDMTIYVRALNLHYSNMTVLNLRLVSGPSDFDTLMALLVETMNTFQVHAGRREPWQP